MKTTVTVQEQRALLDSWYRSMKEFEYEQADQQKMKIESQLDEMTNTELQKLYSIFLVRYHILYNEMKKASEMLKDIQPVKEDRYHWFNYYYYFFNGIIQYELKDQKSAIDSYSRAKSFISDIDIEETAELLYKFACAYFNDYQYSRSIKYGMRSLKIFLNKSHLKRIADCENLLGINYMYVYDYKKAEKHFKSALFYVEKAKNFGLKSMILHNFAILYTKVEKMDSAIDYLIQAYECLPENNNYFQCKNLFILTRSYFSVGATDKALDFLNKGLVFSKENGHLDYYHHFKILASKHLESEADNFEKNYKAGITYFNDSEEWEYVMEFSEELAIFLRGNEKHEEATHYFKLAVDAKRKHLR